MRQPRLPGEEILPKDLPGELLVLSIPHDHNLEFCGQVVELGSLTRCFLFSIQPRVASPGDLPQAGLQFDDFVIGDPVFDYMLFTQSQRVARKRLEASRWQLEWETKLAKLHSRLTVETFDLADAYTAYQLAIRSICEVLEWDIGHLLVPEGAEESPLVSSKVWYLSDPPKFEAFVKATNGMRFYDGVGLPGEALQARTTIGFPSFQGASNFLRKDALQSCPHVSGVAVPVILNKEVLAVVEFFTLREVPDWENTIHLFEAVGLQLGGVVARQRAREREKIQNDSLAQAAKMTTLGELAAGVAHEIRNPLSTASLLIHLLERMLKAGPVSGDQVRVQAERLKLCLEQIEKIVSDLQGFSRDSSRDPYTSASIRAMIERSLSLCHARFARGGVRVSVEPIPEEWAIDCRPSQISQVILNLLSNAYDAALESEARWVKVEVSDRGDWFDISVLDSGSGISTEVADRIMEPFFTTKEVGKGTGLGLSVSSKLVSEHGGRLFLDRSSLHTRFVVALPKHS
jgi:C4-dicarboxylate-specific signal transduction histidine kinase